MQKPTIGYIDPAFHKKTKSTFFLRDILSEQYEVIDLWDESWTGGKILTADYINSFNFDYVLFFQTLLPAVELKQLRSKIILVPMADSTRWLATDYWYELSTIPMKVLSFSSTVSAKLKKIGFDVFNLQYFFDPSTLPTANLNAGKNIFFWQRTDITFAEVKQLIGSQAIQQLILRIDADPGFQPTLPSADDMKKYNIKIINWNVSRQDYLQQLAQCSIFIAPRKYEGIGMTYIEAMTMGLAVIGYNQPTMNEYITDQVNGWLFNQTHPISLERYQTIGLAAKQYCAEGYVRWQKDAKNICTYITATNLAPTHHHYFKLLLIKCFAWFERKILTYKYLHR